jgi:hypothetical protein
MRWIIVWKNKKCKWFRLADEKGSRIQKATNRDLQSAIGEDIEEGLVLMIFDSFDV